MGRGLRIAFYVQKHIAALAMCHNPPLVRDKPLGAPASVKLVFSEQQVGQIHQNLKSVIYNETHAKKMNC